MATLSDRDCAELRDVRAYHSSLGPERVDAVVRRIVERHLEAAARNELAAVPDLSTVRVVGASAISGTRRFRLERESNAIFPDQVGVVAVGALFADGSAVLRWTGQWASTALWPSLEALVATHCHEKSPTALVWEDEHA